MLEELSDTHGYLRIKSGKCIRRTFDDSEHWHIETPRIGFVCAKTREAAIRAAHAHRNAPDRVRLRQDP